MKKPIGLFPICLSATGLLVLGLSLLGWTQDPQAQDPKAEEKQGEKAKQEDQAKGGGTNGKQAADLGTITGKVETRPMKYAKDAWVYIKEVKGTFPLPKKNPEMDQKNLTFVPHVLPVMVGSTVDFVNSDSVLHNIFSPDNEKYNLGSWGKGQAKPYTFKKLGVYTQLCNVHPEMQGFVLVLQNPFWSDVKKDSTYKLDKVPPGTYTVVCWSERLKSVEKEVVVKAGEAITMDFSLKERQ